MKITALSLKTERNLSKSALIVIHPPTLLFLAIFILPHFAIKMVMQYHTGSVIYMNSSAFGKSFRISNHTIIILDIWTLLLLEKQSFPSCELKALGP